MQTRPATTDDVPDVQAVARETWKTAYDFLSREEREAALRERYATDRLESAVADDDGEFVVAVDDSVVGFAHARPVDPAERVGGAELRDVQVRPERWNEAIGRSLLAATEDALRDRGFTQLAVAVFADNERARSFFEARGFEPVEERVEDLFSGGTARQLRYHHDMG
ncbi:GNAT family N-acetyltransferase [halophilic archaeon]|nr:GNAT family N-acetyltransferase [halophilic archaeon]